MDGEPVFAPFSLPGDLGDSLHGSVCSVLWQYLLLVAVGLSLHPSYVHTCLFTCLGHRALPFTHLIHPVSVCLDEEPGVTHPWSDVPGTLLSCLEDPAGSLHVGTLLLRVSTCGRQTEVWRVAGVEVCCAERVCAVGLEHSAAVSSPTRGHLAPWCLFVLTVDEFNLQYFTYEKFSGIVVVAQC